MIKQILQKTQIFRLWWQSLSFFGQKLPSILASASFVVLLFHVSFEMWGVVCEEIRTSNSLSEIILTILKQMIQEIGSDTVRNLSLLLAASISWFFFYWRAKTADLNTEAAEKSAEATRKNAETAEKGLTTERLTRAIEQLAHEKPSIRLGGICSLEQIAKIHEEERKKIMQILSARIRELAPLGDTKKSKEWRERPDIESAIKVLGRDFIKLG